MKKTFFSIILFLIISGVLDCETRIPFSKWPKAKQKLFNNIDVVVAENINLASQGFCGASAKDFNTTIILFPEISEGTEFGNADFGYGTVNSDIEIVFLDKSWNVIAIRMMKKKTGSTCAPEGTYFAIEGIPEIINRIGFRVGEVSPFMIEKIKEKYLLIFSNNHGRKK